MTAVSKETFIFKEKLRKKRTCLKEQFTLTFLFTFFILNFSAKGVGNLPFMPKLLEFQGWTIWIGGVVMAVGIVFAILALLNGRGENPLAVCWKWLLGGLIIYNLDFFLSWLGNTGGMIFS